MRTSLCILFVMLSKLACTTGLRIHNSQPIKTKGQCPKDGITAWGHDDGFGATYSAMIGVYMYAAMQNRTYCTTQWRHTAHGIRMNEMFQWVGGPELGPPATSQTKKMKHYLQFWDTHPYGLHLTDKHIMETRQHIRDAYFGQSKDHASLNLFGASNKTSKNVAWHIRRGDVSEKNGERYTSNVKIGQGLAEMHSAQSLKVVHFFSQGREEDFQTIIDVCVELRIECIWHLNTSVTATHYSLSIADVLVVAHSSFSASAGFLNQGSVLRVDKDMKKTLLMDLQAQWKHMNDISATKYQ